MSQPATTQPVMLPATAELYRQATDVAGVCKEIVLKTAKEIQRKKYIMVEGWQSIATAHGCVASAHSVEKVDGGIRAIGEIRRISDGLVLATAEGFVGDDEDTWAKRPEYARRAMAQTRAISRACRTAFAHVVVLMDAGLSTTPAEEVPSDGFTEAQESLQERSKPAKATKPTPDLSDAPKAVTVPEKWQDCVIHFGKNKDKRLGDLDQRALGWYITEWHPKPFKGRISDADTVLRRMLDRAADEASGNDADQEPVPAGVTTGPEDDEIPGL